MKAEYDTRLRTLERRMNATGDAYLLFETFEASDGPRYRLLNTGRTYTPEAFERLVKEREDAVFVTLQRTELAEAAARAYWEEREAKKPTLEELYAENALVERIRREVDDDYAGDDKDEEMSRRVASAFSTGGGEADDACEQDVATEDDEDDNWVAEVTIDSDRATLARYHEWLLEQGEEWVEEMRRRKERLDEGRGF